MSEEKKLTTLGLMKLIRGAQSTRNAERILLMALVLRARPESRFMCWPSYATLAEDTMLDVTTLRRAAARLEKAGLIRRKKRNSQSNMFYINTSLLQKQADAVAAAAKLAILSEADETDPFSDVSDEVKPTTQDNTDWMRGGAQ